MAKNRLPIQIGIVKYVEFCRKSISFLFPNFNTQAWKRGKRDRPAYTDLSLVNYILFQKDSDCPLAHSLAIVSLSTQSRKQESKEHVVTPIPDSNMGPDHFL